MKDTPYEKDFFFDEVPAHRFSATATEALEGGTARRIRELGIPPEMAPALADLETNQRAQVQLELRSGHAMARRTGRIAADVLTALEGGGLKPEIVSREGRKYHRVSVTVDGKKIAFLLAARDGKSLNDEVKSLRDRAREEERGFVAEWKRLGFSGDP